MSRGLSADAGDLYYSAWISFLDALHGIEKGLCTWATIKLYYSVFYALRASLAVNDICAFHVDRSSYIVLARAGQSPTSCAERGTHKTVMKTFARQNPGHPLISQQIALSDAVDWLIDQRESANYRRVRFAEPDCGEGLAHVVKCGVRRSLNGYLAEPSLLYVFDPDHALVAYPMRALQLVGNQLVGAGLIAFSEEEQVFLRRHSRDRSGGLAVLISEMKRLTLLN
ncbi:MAG TPA: hypothetical protein PLX89_00345 [Verrucomicrobiota bacterium]|nr:hypothetical protein [Verrucomicrobiota bacterium]